MSSSKATNENIKVVVRCRPFNSRERSKRCKNVIEVNRELMEVRISKPGAPEHVAPKRFTFDGVYGEDSTQREIYDETAYPLVENVLEGYNGTIFAYGQTGCGKTFTMEGVDEPAELRGIIPNAFLHIFDSINIDATAAKQFLVRAAYIEIYNEEVRDLLGPDPKAKLHLSEDKDRGIVINGLTHVVVKDVPQIRSLMQRGNKNRTVGFTLMNADSSRSHSIFIVNIETSEPNEDGSGSRIRAGKLNLVDLAGSERQTKTQASGKRLKEATKINLSLSALGNVISALVEGHGRHIPYRDSKLTRLLQDSLGGNTKTIMIAAISPADYNYDETLSTLRYANRAKNIKNKPRINEDPKDALLRQYEEEIQRLKKMLKKQATAGGVAVASGEVPSTANNSQPNHHKGNKKKSHRKSPNDDEDEHKQQFHFTGDGEVRMVEAGSDEASIAAVQAANEAANAKSNAEVEALNERLAESQRDQERLAEEKRRHEELARKLEQQMIHEKQQREKLAQDLAQNEAMRQQREKTAEELARRLQQEKERNEKKAAELEARMAREREAQSQFQEDLKRIQERAEQEKSSYEQQLQALQKQLLVGGQQAADLQAQQEAKLRKAAARLKKEKLRQQELVKERADLEEAKLMAEDKYSSLQEEVRGKTKKLKRLRAKYQDAMQEIGDLQEEFERERQFLVNNAREATREMQLYKQIVSVMMMSDDMERVVSAANWDDDREMWILPNVSQMIKANSPGPMGPGRSHSRGGRATSRTESVAARRRRTNSAHRKIHNRSPGGAGGVGGLSVQTHLYKANGVIESGSARSGNGGGSAVAPPSPARLMPMANRPGGGDLSPAIRSTSADPRGRRSSGHNRSSSSSMGMRPTSKDSSANGNEPAWLRDAKKRVSGKDASAAKSPRWEAPDPLLDNQRPLSARVSVTDSAQEMLAARSEFSRSASPSAEKLPEHMRRRRAQRPSNSGLFINVDKQDQSSSSSGVIDDLPPTPSKKSFQPAPPSPQSASSPANDGSTMMDSSPLLSSDLPSRPSFSASSNSNDGYKSKKKKHKQGVGAEPASPLMASPLRSRGRFKPAQGSPALRSPGLSPRSPMSSNSNNSSAMDDDDPLLSSSMRPRKKSFNPKGADGDENDDALLLQGGNLNRAFKGDADDPMLAAPVPHRPSFSPASGSLSPRRNQHS